MSLTLRQLRYAQAAARYGNVTTAAKVLHVSQPSISMAITQIEEHFGKPVFVRQRGSGVSLTAFGHVVMAKARQLLADAETLETLADADSGLRGELVLGCFEDLAPYCVPSILARLRRRCPAIDVVVREEGFDTIGRHLDDGAIDLAISYDLGLPASSTATILCELAPQALLPAGHALAERASVTMAELAGEPLILTDQAQSWQHVLELFHLCNLRPAQAIRTGSFELQRAMVANGLGVALAYSRPYGDFSYDGRPLLRRPIADPLPLQRIVIAQKARNALAAIQMVFVEETRRWFDEVWPTIHAGAAHVAA
ncbi:MAG TPA: LysR substrate-binding domain-containing protein [Dokdonella sp.]|uniref:LysR substrate-binding domain-containing protein n=1 Tax=Dokdonella sp. TaxID=2291710 RepID=UPI002C167EAD|nr:LysR substrate-binding domain-containing protein [Dokdonella sp.]HUD42794.1 LysR substrate-binding domain-containing protein [Dokdonella sp.]